MESPGRVSVVIPCFNQGHFLPECLESVFLQTYPHVEVIVVNDGSTDATAKLATGYGTRIKYVDQTNQGLCAARNSGIRVATGEFLHFLDSDDYIPPTLYENCVQQFQIRADAAAVYCGVRFVDAGGHPLGVEPPATEQRDVFHTLLEANRWPCHAVMLRKRAQEAVGGFDPDLRSCEDWDFWLRIAALGGCFVPLDEYVYYRRYRHSMSTNHKVMFQAGMRVISRHASRHDHCAECRRRSAKARALWRSSRWEALLRRQMAELCSQGQFGRYLWRCVNIGLYDPLSAWYSLTALGSYLLQTGLDQPQRRLQRARIWAGAQRRKLWRTIVRGHRDAKARNEP
jgi:glycosyltransferase involved in cell wall biosynthesis